MTDWIKIIAIVLSVLFISLLVLIIILEDKDPCKEYTYKMPDGVFCKHSYSDRATIRFSNCEDGKTYVNPETYHLTCKKLKEELTNDN